MNDDLVSLRDFLEAQIAGLADREAARAEAHQQQHAEQRQAVNLAAGLMNERLADMNQFRAQLDRQAALFVTRDQLAALLEALRIATEKDIDALQARANLLEKRNANQDGRFVAVAGALVILIVALTLALHYLFP